MPQSGSELTEQVRSGGTSRRWHRAAGKSVRGWLPFGCWVRPERLRAQGSDAHWTLSALRKLASGGSMWPSGPEVLVGLDGDSDGKLTWGGPRPEGTVRSAVSAGSPSTRKPRPARWAGGRGCHPSF